MICLELHVSYIDLIPLRNVFRHSEIQASATELGVKKRNFGYEAHNTARFKYYTSKWPWHHYLVLF